MKNKSTLMNPFPGLRSFRSDEDYLFFGREEQTLELVQRLQRNRFIAVVGTSGQGKSSLVRCGLLSRLQGGGMVEAGAHWEIAVMHPGGDPFRHLVEGLLEAGLYDRDQEDAVPHLLATLGRSQFGLVQAVRQAALPIRQAQGGPAGTNFLLVVDQFEEIFRYDEAGAAESEAANNFVAMLREAAAQTEVPIYIVATMRSDFIGDCARFEGLAEAVNRGEYLIPRLSRDQFKAAIEGPIRVAGGQIAPRLLQRLLNDLGEQQDQLPCLQHALMRTWRVWQDRADAPALDLEDYARVGKMSQALSVHADEVYLGLATERQRELCAALFKALTVEGSEKRGIRRPRRLQALCRILGVEKTELLPVVDAFRHPDVSFLTPPASVELRDTTVIDLSHESLMRVWTRLRDWVDEEAKSVGIFRRLSESAALWRQGKTGFIRDPELSIARAWLETSRPNASWAEQYDGNFEEAVAFLHASAEAAEKEVRAQEAARQRELEQAKALAEAEGKRAEEQTRFAGRLKWLLRGVGLVAMVAIAATFIAFAARREAQENAVAAQAAEKKAQTAGRMAQNAREHAEKLVTFLLDDFYAELEPTGRLDTIAKLAHEAVAYFDGLPAELRSPVTRRNRAIAQLREGEAMSRAGQRAQALQLITTATDELEKIYNAGDRSEPTVIGLASALVARALRSRLSNDQRTAHYQRGADLIRPLAQHAEASIASKLAYARALISVAGARIPTAQQLSLLDEAKGVLLELGALEFTNLRASSLYGIVTYRLAYAYGSLKQGEEQERLYRESLSIIEKVLRVQPGDVLCLQASGVLNEQLSSLETGRGNPVEAEKRAIAACQAYELALRFDPARTVFLSGLASARRRLAGLLVQDGRIDEGLRTYRAVAEMPLGEANPDAYSVMANIATWEFARGEAEAGEKALADAIRLRAAYVATRRDIENVLVTNAYFEVSVRQMRWNTMDYERLRAEAERARATIEDALSKGNLAEADEQALRYYLCAAYFDVGRSHVVVGNFQAAERAFRKGFEFATPEQATASAGRQAWQWLALCAGKQGRSKEALEFVVKSDVEDYRSAYAKGDHSLRACYLLSRGLLGLAAAQPNDREGNARRRQALEEARRVLDDMTIEAQQLSERRMFVRLVDEERARLPTGTE